MVHAPRGICTSDGHEWLTHERRTGSEDKNWTGAGVGYLDAATTAIVTPFVRTVRPAANRVSEEMCQLSLLVDVARR